MLHRVAAFAEIVLPVLLLRLLSVAFTLGSSDILDALDGISAEFSPKEPLFASGSTMVLNCTLKNAPPGVTAHQVHYTFDSSNLTVVVLNNYTVQIRKENVTRQMSHGHVFCRLSVLGKPFAQVAIRVADIPVAPNITGCVVYNWEKMVCTWELPKQDTGLPTNYRLGWTLLYDDLHPCPDVSGNTCTWINSGPDGLKMDMRYRMVTIAQNELKTVISSPFLIETLKLVKPGPVRDLKLSEITSLSAYVSWTWKLKWDKDSLRPLLYRVNYTSKWHNRTKETTANGTALTNLVPNTNYSISVECLPYWNKIRAGFWSNQAVTQLFTAEDVPGKAPAITGGSYSSLSSSTGRNVEVFWQPVPERWMHGTLIQYRIRCFNYWNRSHIVAKEVSEPYSILQVPADLDLGVTVEASTAKGYNDLLRLKTLVIPRADLAPAEPVIFYAVRNQSEITAIWSSVSGASGYTVYWCKKAGHAGCETWFTWESVSANVTNLTISVGSDKHDEFLVAVSMETFLSALKRTVSSGMKWAGYDPHVDKSTLSSSAGRNVEFFWQSLLALVLTFSHHYSFEPTGSMLHRVAAFAEIVLPVLLLRLLSGAFTLGSSENLYALDDISADDVRK